MYPVMRLLVYFHHQFRLYALLVHLCLNGLNDLLDKSRLVKIDIPGEQSWV